MTMTVTTSTLTPGWSLESLIEAKSWEIGVFLTAGISSIHRMDIEVR